MLLFPVALLFTVAVVDGAGPERALRLLERRWDPAALRAHYRLKGGQAMEGRCVLPGGFFVFQWRVAAQRRASVPELSAVAWTAQPARPNAFITVATSCPCGSKARPQC